MHLSKGQLLGGLLLGALFLCLPAYYNIFPLWFRETPAYLEAGFDNTLSYQNAWPYAGFVRHGSLAESIWLVILLQGFAVSITVYYCFKYVFTTRRPWHYVVYLIFVSMTTAVSFHNSELAPDVFTAVLLLATGLLLFAPALSKGDAFGLCLLLFLAISMHNSHWGIWMSSLLVLGITCLSKTERMAYRATGFSWKRLLLVCSMACSSYVMVSSVHYSLGGDFDVYRGKDFYRFARLWDYNLAQDYLKDHCRDNFLCGHEQESLRGADILWGADTTISLSQNGGWNAENEALFATINEAVLSDSKYWKRYLIKTIEGTFMQLVYVEVNPNQYRWDKNFLNSINRFYPAYAVAARYSRQKMGFYREETVHAKGHLQALVLVFSIVVLLWSLLKQQLPSLQRAFTVFILCGLLANAFVVASCWGYEGRFQSRVAWLITLPAGWLVFRAWDRWYFKE